jgi:hypothetical protein
MLGRQPRRKYDTLYKFFAYISFDKKRKNGDMKIIVCKTWQGSSFPFPIDAVNGTYPSRYLMARAAE